MGGSIIGLFGDFGDGWVPVSMQSGETLEFGGVHLYERNPDIFGLKDGNQRWNQAEVGKTYYDYYFQGITDLENFSTEPGKGEGNLLINGFGLQIQSKSGGVISGKEGEPITVKDLRDGSLGLASAKDGVREIKVEVKRVGIFSSKEGQVDRVISLDDMCVVNVGGKGNVFMIFAGINMGNYTSLWNTNQKEQFIGLNGCDFFRYMSKNEELWLTKVKLGPWSKGEALVLASGQNGNPKGILGWSKEGSKVFKDRLDNSKFGAVALIGIVGKMTEFVPARGCGEGRKQKKGFCHEAKTALGNYQAKEFDQNSYISKKKLFGEWVNLGNEDLKEVASTGRGWKEVRGTVMSEGVGSKPDLSTGWTWKTFYNWVRHQFNGSGWKFPVKMRPGEYMPFWIGDQNDKFIHGRDSEFSSLFKKQLDKNRIGEGTRYEWKKTAVMT